jgi:hypothetical protein
MDFKVDFQLPVRAIPVVMFLAGAVGFGELVIRLPQQTLAQESLAFCMGVLCLASSVLFFVKMLSDWPRTPGLHLD